MDKFSLRALRPVYVESLTFDRCDPDFAALAFCNRPGYSSCRVPLPFKLIVISPRLTPPATVLEAAESRQASSCTS